MAFWKKSEDPWDIAPDQRRTAPEPAEKAPGLLDTLRGDWDAMRAEWQETRESLKLPPEKCPWCGKDMEQGFQGWEYKFNTVASSRGDYPFITVTAGTGTGRFA